MIKQYLNLESEKNENDYALKKKIIIQKSNPENLNLIKDNIQTINRNNYAFDNEIFTNNKRI